MPVAMSVLWDMLKSNSLSSSDKFELATDFDRIFGLNLGHATEKPIEQIEVPEEITALAAQRLEAKNSKNFSKADQLREKIKSLGYEIIDTKEGVTIKKSGT